MRIPRSKLNTRLSVERLTSGTSFTRAGKETWAEVRKVWAQVEDVLPSRGEQQADGFSIATWRARVRMDFRTDITGDMRFVGRGRTMQIVSGPARVENLDAVEFVCAEYSPTRGQA